MHLPTALISALLLFTPPAAAQPGRCDRACLESWLGRYVDAFVAHDPSRLPAATTLTFTENGQRLALGDGAWRTVTGRGNYALPIADVEAGQAVLMGTIREAETPAIFVLRLKVEQQRIRDRRFVALDPERGLAFAFAFFDNGSGDARHGTLADGRKVSSGPSIPWTWQIAEVFKIEGRKIGPVESVLHPVPYGMGSGWSRWEDAMSSQPR
jgi:hypothetical protein